MVSLLGELSAVRRSAVFHAEPLTRPVQDAVLGLRHAATGFSPLEATANDADTADLLTDVSRGNLTTHSQSGRQFFGIHASNDGRIRVFAAGIPLKRSVGGPSG